MHSLFKPKTLVTTLVLLALGYVALWYTVGFRVQKEVTTTLAVWLDEGYRVDHGAIRLSGFPYRFVLEVDDFSVTTRSGGLSIASERITLISHLWTPDHWVAQSAGNNISLAGGSVAFFEEFLQASYRIHNGDRLVIKIDSAGAADMRLTAPEGLPQPSQWSLLLGKDNGAAPENSGLYEKRTLEFRFFAGQDGASLELTGGVSGPALGDWSVPELSLWRDEGGLLELDEVIWRTGDFRLDANGDVTLDQTFRPLGSASLSVSDWSAARATLASFGVRVPTALPSETALMMQNGTALIDGSVLLTLPPVIADR